VKALRTLPAGRDCSRSFGNAGDLIDVGCSGMAGTWGLKAANYGTSRLAGRTGVRGVEPPGLLFGSTELQQLPDAVAGRHRKANAAPVQYLAYASACCPRSATACGSRWAN